MYSGLPLLAPPPHSSKVWKRKNNLPDARLKGACFADAVSLGAGLLA